MAPVPTFLPALPPGTPSDIWWSSPCPSGCLPQAHTSLANPGLRHRAALGNRSTFVLHAPPGVARPPCEADQVLTPGMQSLTGDRTGEVPLDLPFHESWCPLSPDDGAKDPSCFSSGLSKYPKPTLVAFPVFSVCRSPAPAPPTPAVLLSAIFFLKQK